VRDGRAPTGSDIVSTLLLIRHGLCDPIGRWLAGRSPGVHLNAEGRRQAARLAGALARVPIGAIYSSPLERARETAAPLAERTGVGVRISPDLQELDYGEWTGRTLESLANDPIWHRYNSGRGTTRIPGGETMDEVVARASGALADIACAHPGVPAAAVTHGDVIRALLAHWSGMSLDHMLRLEVAPGSVSVVRVEMEPHVVAVNWRPDIGEVLGID
jgi:probable phosphoglycerate mutase